MANAKLNYAKRAVLLTYLGQWAETLWRMLFPLVSVCMAALGASLLAEPAGWPVWGVWSALAVFAVACFVSLLWAVRQARLPRWSAARALVDARFADRPLLALSDAPAAADPGAQAIWDAHIARMVQAAQTARAVDPNFRVAGRDPMGLRLAALLVAALGLVFGTGFAANSVALRPNGGAALGPTWEGWITPPAYTCKPTVYLPDVVGQTVTVPEGSTVMLRIYGDADDFQLIQSVSLADETQPETVSLQTEFQVLRSGPVELSGADGAQWYFDMQEDQAPKVGFAGDFDVDELDQLLQPFWASDDYGVTFGRAFVELDLDGVDRRHGLAIDPAPRTPAELQLPLSGFRDRAGFEGTLTEDMSQSPWVDMPVRIMLEVEDIQGHTGRSDGMVITLPGRSFFDPLAKSMIEQRRDVMWSPHNAPRAAQILRAVSLVPDQVFRDQADHGVLQGIIADLEAVQVHLAQPEDMDGVAQALWDLAIKLEDGDLASAAEALRRAQEKLQEAIRNGADKNEIARLMDELRQAQRDYMREFAQRNPADQQTTQQREAQNGDMVSQGELDQMMQRLQELMEEGRMAEAAELLDEINRLMENLQMGQMGQGQGQPSEGQQAMDDLADTLRDQQDLSDETFQDFQNDELVPGEGENENDTAGELADNQQALRDVLRQQLRNLPGGGSAAGDAARRSLEDAEGAMDEAQRDLREGDVPGAIDRQAEAMESLREGMRNLGRALAEQQNGGSGQGEGQAGDMAGAFEERDPLGRSDGSNSNLGGPRGEMITQEELRRRSQELADEIQRRGGELDRSESERDYLNRLIDQF
ncbi:MAG: DUF4175 domain-containing protein [Planktomarina sp.]